jgi:ribosomal protein S27AE
MTDTRLRVVSPGTDESKWNKEAGPLISAGVGIPGTAPGSALAGAVAPWEADHWLCGHCDFVLIDAAPGHFHASQSTLQCPRCGATNAT